ncbi:PREDICTED: small cell adhesion glycoprotein [Charadrius vociferus]|uniref:small cell adhesion glycoprotein n=1 Tax=Charadrius vociferus TaxID=50402 RepID=UPI000521335F|nr:PREDICTED: small cell adhesion glycoprotein [Charadrius vociferus]
MHESSRKVAETLQEIYSTDWDGHEELKAIADVSPLTRIACYVTIFQNISNLRDVFYKEMSKVGGWQKELTTPSLKKAHTPPLHEDANTVVIAVVITLVFLTLLTVLVVIIVYLYRNKGSYLTYEQPVAETDVSVQMEDAPSKEKEEYFI